MQKNYRICYEGGEGEIVEKKSRFIATVRPVTSEEEVFCFLEEMKKKYWDARHNCYAYILGESNPQMKCSDDGEPSQTAGKPMLDVLLGEELRDVCVVVTRYFGGTLLGTGGLVRAYSQAVKEGLAASRIIEKRPGVKLELTMDYTLVGKVQYLLAGMQLKTLDSRYADQVGFTVLVPAEEVEQVQAKLIEATSARVVMERSDPFYYGQDGEEIILL